MGRPQFVSSLAGELLYVTPVSGWMPALASFSMRVLGFWKCSGELRGGVGLVRQPEHPLDGFHAVFTTRELGELDSAINLECYHLELARARPTLSERRFLVFPADSAAVQGFGIVGRRRIAA
ncbi:MAG TPA: hypothetical protein VM686_07035 [Polyangiaceae bacterium]|nr:hypothetical protein [Polyangiaceae bacterium]